MQDEHCPHRRERGPPVVADDGSNFDIVICDVACRMAKLKKAPKETRVKSETGWLLKISSGTLLLET